MEGVSKELKTDEPAVRASGAEAGPGPDTSVMLAINELQSSLEESARQERALSQQLDAMKRARRSGRPWREVLSLDANIAAVSSVGGIVRRLGASSSKFRRCLAVALVHEGDGLSEAARRLGVTRQRVFTLVRTRQTGHTA